MNDERIVSVSIRTSRTCVTADLAISRSIGDLSAVPCGMSATPEVISRPLRTGASSGGEDAFLILASDGVWEFLSEQDAVDIVTPFYEEAAAKGGKGGRQAQAACRALIERSKFQDGVGDRGHLPGRHLGHRRLPPRLPAHPRGGRQGQGGGQSSLHP